MRATTYPRMIAVSGETFTEAIEKVNAVVFEHRFQNPSYDKATDDGLNWIIHFTETETVLETIADHREAEHTEVHCVECEHFQRILKADGTIDERTKKGYCTLWKHNVYIEGNANDECYMHFEREKGEKVGK